MPLYCFLHYLIVGLWTVLISLRYSEKKSYDAFIYLIYLSISLPIYVSNIFFSYSFEILLYVFILPHSNSSSKAAKFKEATMAN